MIITFTMIVAGLIVLSEAARGRPLQGSCACHTRLYTRCVPREQRYPLACLIVLTVWWAILAIDPSYRDSWFHENLLVWVSVPLLVWLHLRIRLSNATCTLITLFYMLHLVGAHYTYSEVPLFTRLQEQLGWTRNHYDRVVHFSYGLLLAYPIREVFLKTAQARGFWSYLWSLTLVMATSMLYEIIEWLFVLIADPSAGTAFLGAQGDIWDAQKDMGLATIGALLALSVALLVELRKKPEFSEEFVDSLRVKRR